MASGEMDSEFLGLRQKNELPINNSTWIQDDFTNIMVLISTLQVSSGMIE